jgi:hypothetical protein
VWCRHAIVAIVALSPLCTATAGLAQAPADRGSLTITVVDPSRAVIPDAAVTVTGCDKATMDVLQRGLTSQLGVATFVGLATGRYNVQVEFPGFETAVIGDQRVRAGNNRRTVMLPIKKVSETVTVARDRQSSALDPLGNAFSTVLTREMIAALPDDPDEMEEVLKAMAPPGAVIRVDGFTGGRLPPKSQIRSIRLPRMDSFAAQNHGGLSGAIYIDIMTQPGSGPLRGGVDFALRDDRLSARNPFLPNKPDQGLRQYGASLSGTLVPNKASFSLNTQVGRQVDTADIVAALPDGPIAQGVQRPTDRLGPGGSLTVAVTDAHAVRFSFQRTSSTGRNLGVGGFALPEHGYSQDNSFNYVRFSENGLLGRRYFTESRVQVRWSDTTWRPATERPAIVVLDAFTNGGAQQAGVNRVLDFEAATDLDFVRGRHALRGGVLVEGGRYRMAHASNYLGTFTFTSLDAYLAGRPARYTRVVGDPGVAYSNLQIGTYVQDDWRLTRNVLASAGLRYEAQSLIADQNNFSPRVSLTYAPFKNGRTTIRASAGFFTDWIGTSTYQQALQVDGTRQRELNLASPEYPDPGDGGTLAPSNRYLLGPSLVLPESAALTVGVDQTVSAKLRLSAAYSYRRGSSLARGRNLNTPVNGVHPDPAFSNLIECTSDGASRAHSINLSLSTSMISWHRTFAGANYTLTRSDTNTTGPFALPVDGGDLTTEWGPVGPRHRAGAMFNTQPLRNLSVSLNLRAQSGMPYNITTGSDTNGDGVFNDRPAGVRRNSARASAQWDLGGRVSYSIGFGDRPPAGAGGTGGIGGAVAVASGADGAGSSFSYSAGDRRFKVEVYLYVQNVTNRRNYVPPSGVMTSPFFGRPTNVLNPRRGELGIRVVF